MNQPLNERNTSMTSTCEWCGEPADDEQGPLVNNMHSGCAESERSGAMATLLHGKPNPLCYGCGKPVSDELLAFVVDEMISEGETSPTVKDHSLVCERCGEYSVAEAMLQSARDHAQRVLAWAQHMKTAHGIDASSMTLDAMTTAHDRQVADGLTDCTFGRDDDEDTDTCPEHGKQRVIGYGSTLGPDPYSVQRLACGHKVICLGPGEPNILV